MVPDGDSARHLQRHAEGEPTAAATDQGAGHEIARDKTQSRRASSHMDPGGARAIAEASDVRVSDGGERTCGSIGEAGVRGGLLDGKAVRAGVRYAKAGGTRAASASNTHEAAIIEGNAFGIAVLRSPVPADPSR
eukprot:scaffold7714_cov133-Isochrysis_galbana.AAC.6